MRSISATDIFPHSVFYLTDIRFSPPRLTNNSEIKYYKQGIKALLRNQIIGGVTLSSCLSVGRLVGPSVIISQIVPLPCSYRSCLKMTALDCKFWTRKRRGGGRITITRQPTNYCSKTCFVCDNNNTKENSGNHKPLGGILGFCIELA